MGDFARELVKEHLRTAMVGGTAVGLLPIPGAATLALTAVEAAFLAKATELYNDKLDPQGIAEQARDLIPAAGKHVALTTLAEAVGLIPLVGLVAKPFVTRAAMQTLGETAIDFFEKRHPNQVY